MSQPTSYNGVPGVPGVRAFRGNRCIFSGMLRLFLGMCWQMFGDVLCGVLDSSCWYFGHFRGYFVYFGEVLAILRDVLKNFGYVLPLTKVSRVSQATSYNGVPAVPGVRAFRGNRCIFSGVFWLFSGMLWQIFGDVLHGVLDSSHRCFDHFRGSFVYFGRVLAILGDVLANSR